MPVLLVSTLLWSVTLRRPLAASHRFTVIVIFFFPFVRNEMFLRRASHQREAIVTFDVTGRRWSIRDDGGRSSEICDHFPGAILTVRKLILEPLSVWECAQHHGSRLTGNKQSTGTWWQPVCRNYPDMMAKAAACEYFFIFYVFSASSANETKMFIQTRSIL